MKIQIVFVLACDCTTANTDNNDPTCNPTTGQCTCADGHWDKQCDAGTPYGIINIMAEGGGGGGQGDTRLKLKNWTHPKKKC